jgi:hypothetical protein
MPDPPRPLLSGVKLALPPKLLAISHIPQRLNSFLLPTTIDAAVYNDLQRVWYRDRCKVTEALAAGAARGHLQVVKFLWRWRAYRDGEAVLEAAAANGHLEVVRYLLPQHSIRAVGERALAAAAENNHVNVVRLLLTRSRQATIAEHYRISAVEKAAATGHLEIVSLLVERWEVGGGDVMRVNLALDKAMKKRDVQMAKLLLPKCESRGASKVLPDAIEGRYTELVRLLLPLCNAKGMGLAVRAAAASNQAELVGHTLAKCTSGGVVPAAEMVAVQEGFLAAVGRGYIQVVKMMVDSCIEYVHEALLLAVARSRPAMVEILLTACNARYLHYVNRAGLITAATRGNVEMTRLIATKSDDITVGGALEQLGTAVSSDVL